MTTLQCTGDEAQRLLALYMTPEIVAQRQAFLDMVVPHPAARILDVGCGPGLLAAAMAPAVGATGAVAGIDRSEPLLAVARAQCASYPWVDVQYGDATQLPYPAAAFDLVVATQVLEYVHAVDTALAECYRVLRPGGRVAVMDTDWDSLVWHTPHPDRTRRILAAYTAHAVDCYLPRTLANRLRRVGFGVEAVHVLPLCSPTYAPHSYSNCTLDSIVAFVAGREGITREEVDTWAQEVRQFAAHGESFFSLNRYVFLATKP
ncbi:MAG: methyltransferase domain-containing protein [Candidatus Tectimicrobiota bacterium]